MKVVMLWSPFLSSIVFCVVVYVVSQVLYEQTHCNTLELDQLRNLCTGSIAPGPAADCEIFPNCVANEQFNIFDRKVLIATAVTFIVSWVGFHLIKRKKVKL